MPCSNRHWLKGEHREPRAVRSDPGLGHGPEPSAAVSEPLEPVEGQLCSAGAEQLKILGSVSLTIHLTPLVSFAAKFLVVRLVDQLMTDMIWGDLYSC